MMKKPLNGLLFAFVALNSARLMAEDMSNYQVTAYAGGTPTYL